MGREHQIVNMIARYPKRILSTALCVALLAGIGLSQLQADFGYRSWFKPEDPLLASFDEFEDTFGSDEVITILVGSESGIFDHTTVGLLEDLTDRLWQLPLAIRVTSIINYNWVYAQGDEVKVEPFLDGASQLSVTELANRRQIAIDHEVMNGFLINDQATTTMLIVRLQPSLGQSQSYQEVVAAMKDLRLEILEQADDEVIHLSGGPIIDQAFRDYSFKDMNTLMPWVVFLVAIILALVTRRLVGIVLPLVMVMLCIMVTLGLSGWNGLTINSLTGVLPQILVALCLAVNVHIIISYLQLHRRTGNKKKSIIDAAHKNFKPTLITAVSTAIGFLSFTNADIAPVAIFGTLGAVGSMVAWLLTYFVLVPSILILPAKRNSSTVNGESSYPQRILQFVLRWRLPIVVVFSSAVVASFFHVQHLRVNSNPFKYFLPESPLRQAKEFGESQIGGMWGPEIIVKTEGKFGVKDPEFLNKVEEYENYLLSHPQVSRTSSLITIIKQLNRAMHHGSDAAYQIPDSGTAVSELLLLYSFNLPQGMDINDQISLNNDALRLSVYWTVHDSEQALKEIALFEKEAKLRGLDIEITGKNRLYQSMNADIVETFVFSVTFAVLMIALLLGVIFRSFKMAIIAMIPNFIPLLMVGSLLYYLGLSLDIGTVLVAALCLGISVDDTIHFIDNYDFHRKRGLGFQETIVQVYSGTGVALSSTTLILVVSFGLFMFASFIPNINFGIMVALVFSVALFADLIYLPALMSLGRKL